MILGIGIDSVEVNRFAQWHTYDQKKLLRIFSLKEIDYCLSNPGLSAQRFAVRFAAREALFKAISTYWPEHSIPFLTLCRATSISKKRAPIIIVDWDMLKLYGITLEKINLHLSLTHTDQIASAFIILESLQ